MKLLVSLLPILPLLVPAAAEGPALVERDLPSFPPHAAIAAITIAPALIQRAPEPVPADVVAGHEGYAEYLAARQAGEGLSCYAAAASSQRFSACMSQAEAFLIEQNSCSYADITVEAACNCVWLGGVYGCYSAWCPNLAIATVPAVLSTVTSLYGVCSEIGFIVETPVATRAPPRTTAAPVAPTPPPQTRATVAGGTSNPFIAETPVPTPVGGGNGGGSSGGSGSGSGDSGSGSGTDFIGGVGGSGSSGNPPSGASITAVGSLGLVAAGLPLLFAIFL